MIEGKEGWARTIAQSRAQQGRPLPSIDFVASSVGGYGSHNGDPGGSSSSSNGSANAISDSTATTTTTTTSSGSNDSNKRMRRDIIDANGLVENVVRVTKQVGRMVVSFV